MGGRRSGWLASPVINVRATRQGGRGSEEAERCLVFQTSRCAGLVVRLVTMENNAPQPGKLLPPARPARPPGPAPRPAPRPALQRSGGAAGAGREGRARRGAGGLRPWPGLRSAGLGGPGGAGPRRAAPVPARPPELGGGGLGSALSSALQSDGQKAPSCSPAAGCWG